MPEIVPIGYRVRIAPDLDRFVFEGRTEIRLNAPEPVSEITLNAAGLAVWRCRLIHPDAEGDCAFRVDPGREELTVTLPEPMTGEIRLAVDTTGRINDSMAGFYRSRYTDNGRTRYIAVTQFQESDARRAFPCRDHPAAKAFFDIELEVDRNLTAVSNMEINAQEFLENGRKRVIFERTPRMSTYLVFFGVGEFETLQDHVDPRVRVLTLPGMRRFAEYGLEFGRKALEFSEDYYGIPYPLSKMDLIAIPDFAFGAMENWGAITFRENLLLHTPGVTSRSGEERICEVIAHEIAHQWFGNLVTPSDWRFLWLNESFATYFGYGVVAHHHPEWEIWRQFLNGTTSSALSRDALLENYPIEIPGGEHLVINTSTAPIIYDKGGSILRQVEGFIGAENFRKGLQRYLKTHEYDCAASRHLWEAFEAESRQPVTVLMKSWIEQPGFPLVTAAREGAFLVLSQRRFTYLPNDSDQRWVVPVNLRTFNASGDPQFRTILLDEAVKRVEIGAGTTAYKLNDGQTGFYRVHYADRDNLKALGEMVRRKTLAVEDRWGLQNDLFARMISEGLAFDEYLQFLAYYQAEEEYLPLASIAAHLSHAHGVAAPGRRAAVTALAMPWYESLLERIGTAPRPSETQTTAILRDQLLFDAVRYGSAQVEEFALDQFEALTRGGSVHPDILRSVMQTGAWHGDGKAFDWFDQRLGRSESEHERMNILAAIGWFRDPAQIRRAMDFVLTKVPPRNQFIPLVAMSANPQAVPLLWDWYVGHIAELERFHPMLYERVIAAIVPTAGIERADEVRGFFAEYQKRSGKVRDVVRLSLERLEIHLRMRRNCLT